MSPVTGCAAFAVVVGCRVVSWVVVVDYAVAGCGGLCMRLGVLTHVTKAAP